MKKLLSMILLFSAFTSCVCVASLNQPRELLVQSAVTAELRLSNHPGEYVVTLSKMHDYLTYFSDRPIHKVGVIPLADFLNKWKKMTTPTAALVGSSEYFTDKPFHIILTLSQPMYNTKDGSLTYVARPLNGEKIADPIKLYGALLFIEGGDFCCSK